MSPNAKLKRKLATVKELLDANPYMTNGWLRQQWFHRETNGLDACVLQMGRKLLIDVDEFEQWMENGCGHDQNGTTSGPVGPGSSTETPSLRGRLSGARRRHAVPGYYRHCRAHSAPLPCRLRRRGSDPGPGIELEGSFP